MQPSAHHDLPALFCQLGLPSEDGAIERFIDDLSGSSEQDRRRQFSSEYTFLALDLIVQREYPEVHTELLTEAERRMEAFHGGA